MTDKELDLANEYHRGYVDGRASRDANEWSLSMQRDQVVRRLQALKLSRGGDSHAHLSEVASCIITPSHGWTAGAVEMLRCELIRLLGGEAFHPTITTGASLEATLVEYGDAWMQRYLIDGERHTEIAETWAKKIMAMMDDEEDADEE